MLSSVERSSRPSRRNRTRAEVVVVGAHEHPAVQVARDRREHVGAGAPRDALLDGVEAARAERLDDVTPGEGVAGGTSAAPRARVGAERVDERA